ncbi:MAG TPA: ABC transporter permease [Chloroflexota bacterium]|nr:ABC transporter permease [Chloroflexota bacterium]
MTPAQRSSDAVWRWGLRLGTFALFFAWWQFSTRDLHSLLLPTFVSTVAATWELVTQGTIWEPLWISNQALIIGYVISAVVGVPLGLLMSRIRRAERFLDVYLNVLLTTPMAALIPLFIMVLGPTLTARVVIVFVFTFVIVAVDTRAGVRGVDRTVIEMARSFGASEWQIWRRVLLPGALPAILAGLRVGLGRAFTGMVLSELLLVGVGIGRLMLKYRGSFDGDYLYGTILIVVLEAIVCTLLLRLLENRTLSWASDASR